VVGRVLWRERPLRFIVGNAAHEHRGGESAWMKSVRRPGSRMFIDFVVRANAS
jgi:hypothetical protein